MVTLVVDQPLMPNHVVIRIVGESAAMPEFPELSDYVVPSPYDGQYFIAFNGTGLLTTTDKAQARRFNGTEGVLTVLPGLMNLKAVLETVEPAP